MTRECLLQYSISLVPSPPHLVSHDVTHKVDNHNYCHGFQEELQLHWACTTGNQQRLAYYEQRKNLPVASERGCSDFVCLCLWTHLTMELKQKLTKTSPNLEDAHALWSVYTIERKILNVRNCELRKSVCSKGHTFGSLQYRWTAKANTKMAFHTEVHFNWEALL